MSSIDSKTIAFIGASGGCGLAALKLAVAAGHTCIALCRVPSKMDTNFPEKPANLIVREGNAHDQSAVSSCLLHPDDPTRLVDNVNVSLGGLFNAKTFQIDDPDVCKKGIKTLLDAMAQLRTDLGASGSPLISVISTTGISKHKRDVPLLMLPMYHWMLKVPHADKLVMEQLLVASPERYVMVRPSFLVEDKPGQKNVLVGVEDPVKGVEKYQIGYTISRPAVGRWMYENLLQSSADTTPYEKKAVAISW